MWRNNPDLGQTGQIRVKMTIEIKLYYIPCTLSDNVLNRSDNALEDKKG
jgi:hypothetical protein